ncbi:hypothetical protein N657DRAFT_645679 [Parathielavia appendiculata]|uniref:Uncharacterized protein n=1 Tax=Parathielavia appendiculata TaxID=2587402 RepID=A0AAN6U163_9PEZI|nr:hypothetical protein N657DRAFT_645679 [Parathielavia appendiculata]
MSFPLASLATKREPSLQQAAESRQPDSTACPKHHHPVLADSKHYQTALGGAPRHRPQQSVKDFRTSAKPRAQRTNTKLLPRDGVACLDTPYGDAPSIGECQRLCEHFLGQHTHVVTLNPVHMITYWTGNAMFGLANLDPCNARSVQHGVLRLWCSDMLERCIANEMDGYYDAESYHMAAALTGDEAMPPYYFDDHC